MCVKSFFVLRPGIVPRPKCREYQSLEFKPDPSSKNKLENIEYLSLVLRFVICSISSLLQGIFIRSL